MNNNKFKEIINHIPKFGTLQFRILRENVDKRVKAKKVSNILETPFKDIYCPHCKSNYFIRWGKRNDMQRYKCKTCNKTFNSLTNTPLARLRRKGHWLEYANCLKSGLTIREAAKYCSIHNTTSFRWRHRFINNTKQIKAKKLGGIIESKETIIKESFKGSKKTNLKQNRKNIFLIFNIDRNNNIYDITNKGFSKDILQKHLLNKLTSKSYIYTSKNEIYKECFNNTDIKHCNITNKKNIKELDIISNYTFLFRDWIQNHFRGVATKYLENYVSWFRGLNEFKSGINALTILYRAKQVEKYRHQPLKITSVVI